VSSVKVQCACAQTAGLYVGDKIISINNNKVLAKDLEKTLEACSEGDSIKINM
jgi:predicted metalloprotease with PDZ domain